MKLHIGCKGEKIEGVKRLDVVQHGDVDYVQDAKDLSNFEEGSVDEIYASHIFEHFTKPIRRGALKEWNRVLKKGGVLWISVPDFDRIVDLYINMGRVLATWTEHLIHGDQEEPYAYHYACYTFPVLSGELSLAGFNKIQRIGQMPYGVDDASKIVDSIFRQQISLSIKAVK